MNDDIKQIGGHMREFGLHLMGKAVRDSTFAEIGAPFAHSMALTIAAHASEILIKARIAEEHPLLIFSKLPKRTSSSDLSVEDLFSTGRSLQFSELADVLWACTGYHLNNPALFNEFGNIRNAIVHFAVPDIDLSRLTLRFAFEIIQPMVTEFWNAFIVDYSNQYDDEVDVYLAEKLKDMGLTLAANGLVS